MARPGTRAGTRLGRPAHDVRDDVPDPRRSPEDAPRTALRRMLAAGGPRIVVQPQLSLAGRRVTGYEALARFPGLREPDVEGWFALARQAGLGAELEALAVRRALRRRAELPAGTVLAVNVSPAVLLAGGLRQVLPADLRGLELELTEHDADADLDRLAADLGGLRRRGARIAIDDFGAGCSSMHRVVRLRPDAVKLDRRLVTGITADRDREHVVRRVVGIAHDLGAVVCAEGVEDVPDLRVLAALGVDLVQGWAVGRPAHRFLDAEPAALAAAG